MSLEITPIGHVRNEHTLKFETKHQPDSASAETNLITLLPGRQFDLALQDLASFDRIWLVWWFDRNSTWRPRVLPPRGPAIRRGVFATRSPYRPNPIGLTSTELLAVEGLTLIVGPLDLTDGTPILDIKPYLAAVDAFPDSSRGWIGEVEEAMAAAPRFEIEVQDLAARQLAWLRDSFGIDFTERAFELLRNDPSPHRTRRILGLGEGQFRMACGPWRLFFSVADFVVTVESMGKGYSDESLAADLEVQIPHREAQIAFSIQTFQSQM